MMRLAILIRVYNRVEDLQHCVSIIRDTWKYNDYFIIVVFNGANDGYTIDSITLSKIDLLLEIENNTGHFTGNSQLLLEGLKYLPDDCPYTILLEADTWIYSDSLIQIYIEKLADVGAVWASAQFFRYVLNLATDFVIVKTDFVKANPEVFRFQQTPEYYIGNYLKDNGFRFTYIRENMPVNLPRYIKRYPFAPTGRFFMFLPAKMVTHHIEVLKNGMAEKMQDFNIVAGRRYFDIDSNMPRLTRLLLKISVCLTCLLPYRGWFAKRKKIPS